MTPYEALTKAAEICAEKLRGLPHYRMEVPAAILALRDSLPEGGARTYIDPSTGAVMEDSPTAQVAGSDDVAGLAESLAPALRPLTPKEKP